MIEDDDCDFRDVNGVRFDRDLMQVASLLGAARFLLAGRGMRNKGKIDNGEWHEQEAAVNDSETILEVMGKIDACLEQLAMTRPETIVTNFATLDYIGGPGQDFINGFTWGSLMKFYSAVDAVDAKMEDESDAAPEA